MANARLTIGRLGLDVVSGSEVDPYPGISWDGDRLTFSGMLKADTTNGGAVLRQQASGYGPQNTDEPVIPVSWSGDATVDGFYFPVSIEVEADAGSYVGDNWWFPFKADLVKGGDRFKSPLMEIVTSGALRSNSNSITTSVALTGMGIPVGSPSETLMTSPTYLASTVSRNSEDGTSTWQYDSAETLYSATSYYRADVLDYYTSSAKIESLGSTWSAVTGRIHNCSDLVNIRISNGIVRYGFTSGAVTISRWNGLVWSTARTLAIASPTAALSPMWGPRNVTILRNTPESCVIRATAGVGSAPLNEPYMTIRLDRGMTMAEFLYSGGETRKWGILPSTNVTSQVAPAGLTETAPDTNGMRLVMCSPHPMTNDLTKGGFTLTDSNYTVSFGLGLEFNTNGNAANTSTNMIYAYFSAINMRQNVVG